MLMPRIRKYLPYVVIAIICMSLFAKPLANGDEFWNYNFAKNVADGLLPYRDFNIVQTPLSAYIAGAFLSVFGKGLLVHRILGYFLAVSIFCTAYHLCVKISKTSFISIISVLLLFAVHYPYYIYNYNYLSLFVLLLIFEVEICNEEGRAWKHILVGLLAGITLLFKQSTGALIVLANFFVCLYLLKHSNHKRCAIISRALVSGVPALIYVLYLLATGTFADFWEYAVKGIATFSHRTTPIDLIISGPGNIVFFIIIFIGYFMSFKSIRRNGKSNVLISILIFNIAWLMVAYPLCDASHLLCLLVPLTPALFFSVRFKRYKDWEKYVCIVIATVVCVIAITPFSAIGTNYVFSDLNNYKGVVIESSVNERIKTISEYITKKNKEGYNVRIAADAASAYKIPINVYEKDWDMLLVGNIGGNTIESLLSENDKTLYLVYKDSSVLNEQNYFELIDYIKDNYVKIEEVLNFDVYKAPN